MDFIPGFILSLNWYEYNDFENKSHILYKYLDKIMLLKDSSVKIQEVEKLPKFLQEEYIKYNSREITQQDIEAFIKKLEWWSGSSNDETSAQMVGWEKYLEYVEHINTLKQLKRDLMINNLLE